ncbi:carboxypeptidase-like regulatory domain-containing protein [Chitinophaga sp. NPDC101104]|uniref:carboxypeptidase-like regulatory domain-containing protein n=1 Tax=Chitinophaga sp. NPDC101104 TaxID=3390561 RepID=UPI003D05D578
MQPFIPFILFSLLFPATSSMAQQPLTLRGQVVNARSGAPLPGSSVSIPALSIHTLTNDQGLFVLKLPSLQAADSCIVSHIGYGTRRFRMDRDETGRYPLTEQSLSLHAFQVNSISPRNLIEKAVQHIPENYLASPHVLRGFYRLTSIWSSAPDGDFPRFDMTDLPLDMPN